MQTEVSPYVPAQDLAALPDHPVVIVAPPHLHGAAIGNAHEIEVALLADLGLHQRRTAHLHPVGDRAAVVPGRKGMYLRATNAAANRLAGEPPPS